ncbi:MAG: hypothetical protein AAAC47_30080, partial [Pararhizobium sp.]
MTHIWLASHSDASDEETGRKIIAEPSSGELSIEYPILSGVNASWLVPACRSLSGDGEASNKLLASKDDERHDGHHKAPPEAQLFDDPDARCLE